MKKREINITSFIFEAIAFLLLIVFLLYETKCDYQDGKTIMPITLTQHLGIAVLAAVKLIVTAYEFCRQRRTAFSILVNCMAAFLLASTLTAGSLACLFLEEYRTDIFVLVVSVILLLAIAALAVFWGMKQVRRYKQKRYE